MNNITQELINLENGDKEKLLSMFALGCGSILAGMIPYKFGSCNRSCPFILSLLLCFGAGILLATALVHMLPDVRKTMPENAEIVLCGGFFIIYFIDEFIHYFFGEAIQHSHVNTNERNTPHSHGSYGSMDHSERRQLLENSSDNHDAEDNNVSHIYCNTEEANARICHVMHNEPCTDAITGTIGLLLALSLHSFIEGLAIGVQNSRQRVLFLLAAVSAHKFVMAFCLGIAFSSNTSSTLKSHLLAIVIFSLGSVLGICTGMGIVDLPNIATKNVLPILQALAGGTLLYVTVCEVLPREKARWHQNPSKRIAGLMQFFAISVGFAVMTLIDYYLDDNA